MLYKKIVISVQDIIFNEDKIWDCILLQNTTNKIKELDKAIQVIKLLQKNKLEDIQLGKNLEVESKITHQTNHEEEDLHTNNVILKTDIYKLAEDED